MNFWEPIRNGGGVFSGPPVPHERGHIGKQTRNIEVCLHVNNGDCYVRVWFDRKKTENTSERRNRIKDLFRCSEYKYEDADTEEYRTLIFPVCNKGKNDRDDWDEIRDKLVNMGEDIYRIIDRSDL